MSECKHGFEDCAVCHDAGGNMMPEPSPTPIMDELLSSDYMEVDLRRQGFRFERQLAEAERKLAGATCQILKLEETLGYAEHSIEAYKEAEAEAQATIASLRSEIKRLRRILTDAMDILRSQMPCGAIGEDGPTEEELLACIEETGGPWEGDAVYHAAQQTWRTLEYATTED